MSSIKLSTDNINDIAKNAVSRFNRDWCHAYLKNMGDKTEVHIKYAFIVPNYLKCLTDDEDTKASKIGSRTSNLADDKKQITMLEEQLQNSSDEFIAAINEKAIELFKTHGWDVTSISRTFEMIIIKMKPIDDRPICMVPSTKASFKPREDYKPRESHFKSREDFKSRDDFKSREDKPRDKSSIRDCFAYNNPETGCDTKDCTYRHDPDMLKQVKLALESDSKIKKLCNHWRDLDKCPFKSKCNFYHPVSAGAGGGAGSEIKIKKSSITNTYTKGSEAVESS